MDSHHVPRTMLLRVVLGWYSVLCRLSSVNRDSVRVNLDVQLRQFRRNAVTIQTGKVLFVGRHESINKVLQLCARHASFSFRFHRIFCLLPPIVNIFRIGDLNHQHHIQQVIHFCKIFQKLVDLRNITSAGILDGLETHAPSFQNYEVYWSLDRRPVLFWHAITSSFVRGLIVAWNIDFVTWSAMGEGTDGVAHQVNVHSTGIPTEF
mmetsp:Transcript_3810/g.16513  ORF Transcript_3810/g.16513 Transcript_3810/m.16513 type:complete len:207 (-) Transcript_3810:1064-1684(-)